MKKKILLIISILLIATTSVKATIQTGSDTISLVFTTKEEAAKLLQQDDDFTRNWSKFDYVCYTGQSNGTKEDFNRFIAEQTREWTPEEKELLLAASQDFNRFIKQQGLKFSFPSEIQMLKTTMAEAKGAGGYTRDKYIVLINRLLTAPKEKVTTLLAHELFHILTRNNPEFRKKMYSLIDFHVLPKKITFPTELKERIISNPDVPPHDSYSTFTINGKQQDCCMVIYTHKPYDGGTLMDYINVGFVPIDKQSGKALEKDGKAIIYSIYDCSDFEKKIGANTQYIIDPEEVLADNFSFLLTDVKELASPKLVEQMKEACKMNTGSN